MNIRSVPLRMLDNPLDAVAAPLRKFEGAGAAAAAKQGGSPLDGAPFEVVALFAVLVLVGVVGLVRSSGALNDLAPTVGLGESRDEKQAEANEAAAKGSIEEMADMSQAEKEKRYFGEIADELAEKRGGA